MKNQFLHNPRCRKSREALALLEEKGIAVPVRLYLEDSLSASELMELASILGKALPDFLRSKEAKDAGFDLKDTCSDEEWATRVQNHPLLLERPIFIWNGNACVGRPPQDVLDLL